MILQGIRGILLPSVLVLTGASMVATQEKQDPEVKRPSLSLKASPNVSFTPARVSLVAELKGGPNDLEEFYCPTIEWNWGDGTTSQTTTDCDPYVSGKSEIQRRFTAQRVYRTSGNFRILLILKRGDRVLATASTSIQVRGGLRDSYGF